MSEKPKKKDKLCERRTISFDADLYALALQRMREEGETMFSRYVQALVRKDTAALRAKFINKVEEFPLYKIAEDPAHGSNPVEQKHNSGQDAPVLLDPAGGGSNPAPIQYPRPKRGKSSK